jgi:hypothetical protein
LGRRGRDDEPLDVPTERVVPRVSGPAFGSWSGEPDGPDASAVRSAPAVLDAPEDRERAAFEVPWASLPHLSKGVVILAIATAVGVGTSLVSGDVRIGLTSMVVVGLGGYVRTSDRLVPFSFGQGFVGYRPDPVWPRGVQEDYDVHWDWRPQRPSREEQGR